MRRTCRAFLSNSGSNRARRLRLLQLNPKAYKRIERSGRDIARTRSERLSCLRPLPVSAAVRLSPGSPIKALDPVGTGFLLLYYVE